MKFNYYSETDSLYISLSDKSSVDSQEIIPNIVLDFDIEGKLVGIDTVDLSKLEVESLPISLTQAQISQK